MLVQGVAGTEGATGYFGYTYYEENADTLKALAIDDGNGCVEPSAETAQAGEYTPLARPLFIYVNNATYTDNAAVKEYVDFYIENLADDRRGGEVHPAQRRAVRRDAVRPRGHRGLTPGPDQRSHEHHRQPRAGPPSGAGLPARSVDLQRQVAARARPSSRASCWSAALLSVAITIGIIVALIEPVIDFFGEVPFGDFFATEGAVRRASRWSPATLMVTVIALLVAVPLGLGAAMYLSEYASPRARKIAQADRRAAGRRAVGGLRLLRPDLRHARRCCRTS